MTSINKRIAEYEKSIYDKYASIKYFEVPEQDIPY
jgi:hypothetical protein